MNKKEMKKAIEDIINSGDITDFKCDGIQTEHNSALELVKWEFDDVDAMVNEIIGVFSNYLEWCLE